MTAGAAIIRQQNRYMRAFRQAGAVTPDAARSLEELDLRGSWIFRRLIARGVFKPAEDNRWYLDEFAASAFVRHRHFKIVSFLIVLAVTWLLFMMFWQ